MKLDASAVLIFILRTLEACMESGPANALFLSSSTNSANFETLGSMIKSCVQFLITTPVKEETDDLRKRVIFIFRSCIRIAKYLETSFTNRNWENKGNCLL